MNHRIPEQTPRAFSLIEIIGVLAVISILAAVAVPALIRQMDRIAGEQESAALKSFGDAMQQSILRRRYVPNAADWATHIAAELGVDVAGVRTNQARRQPRFFLIDPALQIGTNAAGQSYTQTNTGSMLPVSPRMMFLSSIGSALPTSIVSGVPSATDFNAIWNWDDAVGTVPPAPAFAGWAGRGDDVKVQRVNLAPHFVRVLLSTYASTDSPRYSIDSTNWAQAVVITNDASVIDRYFLKNSILVLHKPRTNIDSQHILARDTAYVFDKNEWRGTIGGGSFLAGLDIPSIVDQYLKAPENPNAFYTSANNLHGNTSTSITHQLVVVNNMIAYLDAYSAWADSNFQDSGLRSAAIDTQEELMVAVQRQYQQGGGSENYTPIANTNYPPCTPP